MLYRFRLDGGPDLFPDPASRFQPDGPFGPSQIIDPGSFQWTDAGWQGMSIHRQIIYEIHIGTYTPEGTWESARQWLEAMASTGITVVELMPVADFPGRFGWGYDGVDLFAPSRLYGSPDDMRRFVDSAHALGIGVLLDVVYNHLGPVANFLGEFSDWYFSGTNITDWGKAINYDGENSRPVREFFLANAVYWIREFHLDGLRLDATQSIFDRSGNSIIAALGREARRAAGSRKVVLTVENEPQQASMVRPLTEGGSGMDGIWDDDFHHTAMVALTGRREAYYTDYLGNPQEFISSIKRGFLYQGQFYSWQANRRGTWTGGIPLERFVHYLQNHDQVANSAYGLRVQQMTSPGRYRALTALLLLAPQTPLLFQGQEFAASSPFLYFCDLPGLDEEVHAGRIKFLSQFKTLAHPAMRPFFPSPCTTETFNRCKLDHSERKTHAADHLLHQDLLRMRREDQVFRAQGSGGIDGAVLGAQAFLIRHFGHDCDDRLILVNLGRDLDLTTAPEPLLAPPALCSWNAAWSSEDPRYGGSGMLVPEDGAGRWTVQGESTTVLRAVRNDTTYDAR